MNSIFPPNSWRVGLLAFVGSGVLAFIHSRPLLDWAYGDTTAASAEYRQSVLTVGILLAGVAAWVSSSVAAPNNAHAPAGAVRRGAPLVLSNLSYLFVTGASGFAAGLAPVTWHTASSKVYGTFDLAAIAAGFAGLLVYIAMGYLVGCLLPAYIAIPIALGLSYVMVFFTSHVLSPALVFDVISGLEVPSQVSLVRLLYFGACIGAAALAASAWLRMRSTIEVKVPGVTVVGALLPLALITYAANSYSGSLVRADGAEPVCEDAATSEVCLHPARAELLPAIADSVEVMSSRAGPDIVPTSTFVDATLSIPEAEESTALTLQIQGQSNRWLSFARGDIASYAAGIDACYRGGKPDNTGRNVSSAVAGWLQVISGWPANLPFPSPGAQQQLDAFERMGVTEAKRAIESALPEIQQCSAQRIR